MDLVITQFRQQGPILYERTCIIIRQFTMNVYRRYKLSNILHIQILILMLELKVYVYYEPGFRNERRHYFIDFSFKRTFPSS